MPDTSTLWVPGHAPGGAPDASALWLVPGHASERQLAAVHVDDGGRRGDRLSQVAIRGGAYIVRREGIGMLIRLAGVVVTVREIGPGAYGLYSAALAFVTVAAVMAQMGSEVYLIRQPGELGREYFDRAYTFLLCTSLVVTVVCLCGTVAFAPWLRPVGVLFPLRIMLLSIPINVLWAPGQAHIERQFAYRRLGWLEIGGDVALYGTAVPLAILHFGAWSLVAGYFVWQAYLLVGSLLFSGLRPRWNWSRDDMVTLVRHGSGFSATQAVVRLNGVVSALVVGTFAGATGVGYVSFALRLVDTVGFASRGAYRLGLVAMSKVPDIDRHRLRFAIEQGSILQMLALGVPFAGFAVASPWLVPALFGHEWTAAIPVFAVLALVATLNAPSMIMGTFLLSRGQNLRCCLSALIGVVVLAVASVVLVRHLGVVGFGWASLIALVDTVYLDRMVRRTTDVAYRSMAAFAAVLAPSILFPLFPRPAAFAALAPLGLLLVVPALRAETVRIVALVRTALGRSPA